MIGTEFEVWVCPKCKSCTAFPSIQGIDLAQKWNRDIKAKKTFTRDLCQRCSTSTTPVHRVRCIAVVQRELEVQPPIMTEAEYYRYMEEMRTQR